MYRCNVQNSSNPNYITWYYGQIKLKFLVILIGYIYCTAGIFFAKTNNPLPKLRESEGQKNNAYIFSTNSL